MDCQNTVSFEFSSFVSSCFSSNTNTKTRKQENTKIDCNTTPKLHQFVFRLSKLAGFLFAAGLGCSEQSQVTVSPESVPPHAKIVKADDLPKRTPKASTCVAFGDLRVKGVIQGDFKGPEREPALEQARKAYEQAMRIDPKNIDAYQGLAQVHQLSGDYNGALAVYHKGLKVDSGAASLWYDMGMCEARHGDWKTAVENLAKASNLEPENRTYTKSLAFALARTGRSEESVACFKKVMDESQARYNVARLLHHFNQDELSARQLQLALQSNPNNQPALELLAELEGRNASPGQQATAGRSPAIDIDDMSRDLDPRQGNAN